MKHRLITYPTFWEGEATVINELFDRGLPLLHLRKPKANIEAYQSLLRQIDSQYHTQIILHDYPALTHFFDLGGLHLSEKKRQDLENKKMLLDYCNQYPNLKIGTSIHQYSSLKNLNSCLDYAFVSPVFDSISKQGYYASFDWNFQKNNSYSFQIIALGGLSLATLATAQKKGFEEVAFLGAVWGDLSNPIQNYKNICKKITGLIL